MGEIKKLVVGIGDAAKMLNVSRDTIVRMINEKELPAVTIRNQRKILLKSIYEKVGMTEGDQDGSN